MEMAVVAVLDLMLPEHLQHLIITVIRKNRRIMEKHDRLQPIGNGRPDRNLQPLCLARVDLRIRRLGRLDIDPASCAADSIALICIVVVMENMERIEMVLA